MAVKMQGFTIDMKNMISGKDNIIIKLETKLNGQDQRIREL